MKYVIGFFLAAAITYGAWPYHSLYRIDHVLGLDGPELLDPFVDIDALRENYRNRIGARLERLLPGEAVAPVRDWLEEPLEKFGKEAVAQAVTLEWARARLREATRMHSDRPVPYFLSAIDYAFFESWNLFLVRLGEIGKGEIFVRLRLQDGTWRIIDIID